MGLLTDARINQHCFVWEAGFLKEQGDLGRICKRGLKALLTMAHT